MRGSVYLLDIEVVCVVKDGGCKFQICKEDTNILQWRAESPEEAIEWVTAIEVINNIYLNPNPSPNICMCVYSTTDTFHSTMHS